MASRPSNEEARDFIYSMAYNNPFNLYSLTKKPTKESVISQIVWQAIPAGSYVAAVVYGAEVAGYVGPWSVPTALGAPLIATAWLFGAVSAAALAVDIHRRPEVLEAGLHISSSNRGILAGMTSLGSMV